MKLQQKCAKCRVVLVYFRMVLMLGPKGFRRYAVCDKCAAKLEKVKKEKIHANI